jgi:hypothetical protein
MDPLKDGKLDFLVDFFGDFLGFAIRNYTQNWNYRLEKQGFFGSTCLTEEVRRHD